MAGEFLTSARLESKKTFNLPSGAKIVKKNVSLTVREIENGFII